MDKVVIKGLPNQGMIESGDDVHCKRSCRLKTFEEIQEGELIHMVMRSLFILVFLALLMSPFAHAGDLTGKVTAVADGNNITVLTDNSQRIKIRLFGIDCPEKSQAYGKEAKQFSSDLVLGKRVKIWPIEKDRYGRTVGWVFTAEKNLNKELLLAGLAWHDKQRSSDIALAAMEMKARAAKKGLWADPTSIPPWEFRSKMKGN
jgi:endonuclease YncB( thermonuclease family)